MNNIEKIKIEISNIRFHLNSLRLICELMPSKEIKTEIHVSLKKLKELQNKLADEYVNQLRTACPNADALYEDKIISLIGEKEFNHVYFHCKKIQLCACINGRRLYAI